MLLSVLQPPGNSTLLRLTSLSLFEPNLIAGGVACGQFAALPRFLSLESRFIDRQTQTLFVNLRGLKPFP